MDFNIPPFEDLLRSEASEPDSGVDLDALMAKIVGGDPVVTKAEPSAFAGRPGRADAQELLAQRFQRFKAPAPTSSPNNSDLEKMVHDLVAAQMKALSPSTMSRPATQAAPSQPTSPEAATWDWGDDLGDGAKLIPRKQTEPPSAKYAAGASIDDDAIAKRVSSESRENGLLSWMRKQIEAGETVESLAKFAEDNGEHASAEQFRELAKQL